MAQIKHYKCDCGYELNTWNGPNYLGNEMNRTLRCRKCGEYQVVCEDWHPGEKLRDVNEYSCDSCGAKGEMEEVTEEQMKKGFTCPVCGKLMQADESIMVD